MVTCEDCELLDEKDNLKMTPFMLGKMMRSQNATDSQIPYDLRDNIKRNLSINLSFLSQRNVTTSTTSQQSMYLNRYVYLVAVLLTFQKMLHRTYSTRIHEIDFYGLDNLAKTFYKDECAYDYQDPFGNTILHQIMLEIGCADDFICASKIVRLMDSMEVFKKHKKILKLRNLDGYTVQDILRKRAFWNTEMADMIATHDDVGVSKNFILNFSQEERIKHHLITEQELLKVSKPSLYDF